MGFLQELGRSLGLTPETGTETMEHIQGWTVQNDVGEDLGRVDDVMYDDEHNEIRYAIVKVENRQVLVPIGELYVDDTGRRVIARGYDRRRLMALRAYDRASWSQDTERAHYRDVHPETTDQSQLDYRTRPFRGDVSKRIQLMEEKLKINKGREQIGQAEISKRPVTETVERDVTLQRERAEIERRPINQPAEGREIARGPETINVPLYGEKVEVEKTPMIKEEVTLNKVPEQRTEKVREQVTREELDTSGLKERDRELTFTGSTPTEEELRQREVVEKNRLRRPVETTEDVNVDVTPLDPGINTPYGEERPL